MTTKIANETSFKHILAGNQMTALLGITLCRRWHDPSEVQVANNVARVGNLCIEQLDKKPKRPLRHSSRVQQTAGRYTDGRGIGKIPGLIQMFNAGKR